MARSRLLARSDTTPGSPGRCTRERWARSSAPAREIAIEVVRGEPGELRHGRGGRATPRACLDHRAQRREGLLAGYPCPPRGAADEHDLAARRLLAIMSRELAR